LQWAVRFSGQTKEGLKMAKHTLTPEQYKVFDQIEPTLVRAFDEARAKLAAAGFKADDDTMSCTRCDCDQFIHRQGSNNCGRATCGHSFFRHNVW
jgi:hypothetical protein